MHNCVGQHAVWISDDVFVLDPQMKVPHHTLCVHPKIIYTHHAKLLENVTCIIIIPTFLFLQSGEVLVGLVGGLFFLRVYILRRLMLAFFFSTLPSTVLSSYRPFPRSWLMVYGPCHSGLSFPPFLCFCAVFSRSTSVPSGITCGWCFLS